MLINCTRVQGLDATDAEDLTSAEQEGRKQVLMIAEFLQRDVPGFKRASISAVATQIGIRESRRIIGHYALTQVDVVAGQKFEDVIARSGYPIDIHDPSGQGVVAAFIEGDGAYDIPYRCLISRNIRNLLAAGRCISTTHEAHATTRLTQAVWLPGGRGNSGCTHSEDEAGPGGTADRAVTGGITSQRSSDLADELIVDELGESGESLIVGVGVYLIRGGGVSFNEPEASNSGL